MIIPSILCGGIGERLWPITSHKNPKQFIPLVSKKCLYEFALERAEIFKNEIIIVTSLDNQNLIKKFHTKKRLKTHTIFEEVGRNTTAAVWFSARKAFEINPDSNVLIMPSDHLISNISKFQKSILESEKFIKNNWIVFGIVPKKPSTDFGYIKTEIVKGEKVFKSFIEKPSFNRANDFIKDKNYFWNSGIFLASAKTILSSIKFYAPDIYDKCEKSWKKKCPIGKNIILKEKYCNLIRSESIDYSVIEKEKNIIFKSLESDWDDLGSWDSISNHPSANFMDNKKNTYMYNSKNTNILTRNNKIACIDVDDILVVSEGDVTLIFKKGSSKHIRSIKKHFEENKH